MSDDVAGVEAGLRLAVGAARRVVLKVGSSSLTGPAGGDIDLDRLTALVDVIASVRGRGRGGEVVLVSSGAIAAGLGTLGLSRRPRDLATQQAAASVGQGALVAAYARGFARHNLSVGQVLLTADDVTRRTHYVNARRTLTRLLDLGMVPIVNENDTVATQEIRFGDNDRLAALVAHLVGADALVLLTDVDALYDGPPSVAGSSRISAVTAPEQLSHIEIAGTGSSVGSGGMRTKVESASIAGAAGIPAVVSCLDDAARALAGEDVGTIFAPVERAHGSRHWWIAHATSALGQLVVDEGAVRALTARGTSLLPAGIVEVRGTFGGGDPVDVCGPDGVVVARGLVNYSSRELPAMLGRSTRELARELGAEYEREVIHRDDLVLL